MRVIYWLYGFMFLIGVGLMGLNLLGMVIPLRNPAIAQEYSPYSPAVLLTPQQFYALVANRSGTTSDYLYRANTAVHQTIMHYWELEGMAKYNLRPPIYENWLLYLFLISAKPGADTRWEFCDYHKAIERGAGWCSQKALVLASVLDEQGIPAKIVEFPWKHVVVTAQADERHWWVLDPDFGVVIELDMAQIAANPEAVRPSYAQAGYTAEQVDGVVNILSGPYKLHASAKAYLGVRCELELWSYRLSWVIPIVFMIVGILPYVRKRRKAHAPDIA